MSKYTPGPWTAHFEEAYFVTGIDGGRVAMITHSKGPYGVGGRRSAEETAANCRLMAAAPDLLKALTRLEFAAQCRDNTLGDPCRLLDVKAELAAAAEQARAAIAKAGGNIPPDCYRQHDELAEENVSQGQVYWEVLNGVCSYGFYGTKDEAEKVCFDMQKSHDLSGSLAAFNVRPRYTKAGGES